MIKEIIMVGMFMFGTFMIGYSIGKRADKPTPTVAGYNGIIFLDIPMGAKVEVVRSFPNDSDFGKIGTVVGVHCWAARPIYYMVEFDPNLKAWHGYKAEELRLVK